MTAKELLPLIYKKLDEAHSGAAARYRDHKADYNDAPALAVEGRLSGEVGGLLKALSIIEAIEKERVL